MIRVILPLYIVIDLNAYILGILRKKAILHQFTAEFDY